MARVPDSPCASCGKLLWLGSTSKPKGEAVCNTCRRVQFAHGTRKGYREVGCRCEACAGWARSATSGYRQTLRDQGIRLPGGSGPWISPRIRQAVFERDSWTCLLCLGPVDPAADPQSDWYPSLDHVVPQAKGGGHDIDNLRTAHRWCNSIRGAEDRHYLFEDAS